MRLSLLIPLVAAALAAQEPAAEISPVSERKLSYSIDTGNRFLTGVGGDFNTYRSVVNLGEGPKLFGFEAALEDPGSAWINRLIVSASSWGGEPYNTLRATAEKDRVWRLTADYRNVAYFNFLPSFANPTFEAGGGFNQRSFDIERRNANVELELLPGARISPYLIFARDSGNGSGITPFVANGNEYPIAALMRDETNHYRGGVRLELPRTHVTLEQGGSTFKDDQRNSTSQLNLGNRRAPIFGRQLLLNSAEQAYGVRGRNLYTKGILTSAPASWLHFYGQFLYSRPTSDVRFSENADGLFFLGATRFFNGLGALLSSEAKQPRTAASAGVEFKPHRRFRVFESWSTDRLHNAGSALLAERLLFSNGPAELRDLFEPTRLVMNLNRQQADLFFDLTSKLTLRGGHRFVWGDAIAPASFLASGPGQGEIRRHVGLAAVNYRPSTAVAANVEYEGSPGDKAYFRTSLQNYHQLRARLRWQLMSSLRLGATYLFLDNRNPAQGIDYEFQTRSAGITLEWRPGDAKYFSILGDYTRSTWRSDIDFLTPQNLRPARSFYRDNGHTASALTQFRIPCSAQFQPLIEAGGSLFISSGSRPTDYWQPIGRAILPVSKGVSLYGEWRWYGMNQAFFMVEGFRTHQFVSGLRISR
ncbi:MAG: hypothetical protein FJW20_01720 [Acidimicrobiia bacterium]|nr:hypothetical protein [Acidimicrobiia bacterium]